MLWFMICDLGIPESKGSVHYLLLLKGFLYINFFFTNTDKAYQYNT